MKFLPNCNCRVPSHIAPARVSGTFFFCKRLALPLLVIPILMARPGTGAENLTSPASAISSEDDGAATLSAFIQQLADSLQAEFGVACHDLETSRQFYFNDKTMMHAASTMKVPVMIEVFRQAEAGALRLSDSVAIQNRFYSIVDSSVFRMELGEDSDESLYRAIGDSMTVHELVYQMITVSSNLATNLLIDIVGAQQVMQTMKELGAPNMQVLRGVEDIKAYEAGLNNRTDAHSLMRVLVAIAQNRAASPAACERMIEILKAQRFRDKIPAGLPAGVEVGNKTGSITKICHDGAIIFPPGRRPLVLAVLSRGLADQQQAARAIAAITREIYECFSKSHAE